MKQYYERLHIRCINPSLSVCLSVFHWRKMRLHLMVILAGWCCVFIWVCLYEWAAGLAVRAESFSSLTGSQGWAARTMPSSHEHLNGLFVAPGGRMSRLCIQIRPCTLQHTLTYRCSNRLNLCYSIPLVSSCLLKKNTFIKLFNKINISNVDLNTDASAGLFWVPQKHC